jgi:hypothetical protein
MRTPTIFLNELSLTTDRDLELQELLPHVLATLSAAREAKKLRRDLILVGGLAGVVFGGGPHTLASVLRGADYREEWRSVREMDQASPYGPDDWAMPGELEEVRFLGIAGVGMSRALENSSAILSFAFRQVWDLPYLQATHSKLDDTGAVVSNHVDVPNLAKQEHVATHEELVREIGIDLSRSSIIYKGEGFVLRIYFNDHNPPHFHVMAQSNTSETLARFRIDTMDQLDQSGSLRPGVRRQIIDWAEGRREALMGCWRQCRDHRHPARLE